MSLRLPSTGQAGPLTAVGVCFACGLLLGRAGGGLWLWVALAGLAALPALAGVVLRPRWGRHCKRVGLVTAWLSLLAAGAAYMSLREDYAHRHSIGPFVQETSQLARVIGTVEGPVESYVPRRGDFSRFTYQSPTSYARIRVEYLEVDGNWVPVSGLLLARFYETDHRLVIGQRGVFHGWLRGFGPPGNIGDGDHRASLRRRGIEGRLAVTRRGHWWPLSDDLDAGDIAAPRLGVRRVFYPLARLHQRCIDAAGWSLNLGLEPQGDPAAVTLANLMLLGQRRGDDGQLYEQFQDVGLAHVLAISGAHLGILLGLIWIVARLLIGHPRWATLAVLAVLLLYLGIVPWRTPIVRASMMAGVFAVALMAGRRIAPLDTLALAMIAVLLWQPAELLSPGFQLSFLVVAGLILLTGPLTGGFLNLTAPRRLRLGGQPPGRWRLWLASLVAVNVVASLVALPLVAWHFQMLTPWAALMAIAVTPLLTLALAIGFLKLVVGLVFPSLGTLLAGPLIWMAQIMLALVENGRHWPAATFRWPHPPSIAWCLLWCVVLFGAILLPRCRLRWLAGGMTLLILWLIVAAPWTVRQPQAPPAWQAPPLADAGPVAHERVVDLTMFDVGDGNSHLLRFASGVNVLFDCGSHSYLNVGRGSIVPSLRRLGVKHLDLLLISHAHLDHYNATLAVMRAMPVRRVLVQPFMVRDAHAHPRSAAADFLRRVQAMGVEMDVVSAGWRMLLDEAALELLWPDPLLEPRTTNDTSMVLRVTAAGRSILLSGDVEQHAKQVLLEREVNLRADVAELPHHGSPVRATPLWLDAVAPQVVLQSTGLRRLDRDPWPQMLEPRDIARFTTPWHGMVQVIIRRDGAMAVHTWREP